MKSSRRKFLSDSGKVVAAGLVAPLLPASVYGFSIGKKHAPSDEVRIALIGARGMGFGNLENALKQPGVTCVGLCDIDDSILSRRSADVEKIQGKAPVTYKDFRKLLEVKDLDAVIIGTPDHWHCLPMVEACMAGKDVYVEKPLGNSIAECDLMVKAARKYNRVVQVGQQQRSSPHFQEAIAFLHAGKIGTIRKVNVWGNFNYGVGPVAVPDGPVPAGVDYDRWLGPAPLRPFNQSRFHGSWRMFWDYGGGLLTDWGVHLLDVALWAKNITTLPRWVNATGGNYAYADHAHETFDTMGVQYQLDDFLIDWQHTAGNQTGPYGRSYGLAFVGNDATLVIDRDGWEVFPEWDNDKKAFKVPEMPKQAGSQGHEAHMKNFLASIKSRQDPACTIENGRLVAAYAHMGNISLRTQTRLEWDEAHQNFGKNKAANDLLHPTYRKPWVLPQI